MDLGDAAGFLWGERRVVAIVKPRRRVRGFVVLILAGTRHSNNASRSMILQTNLGQDFFQKDPAAAWSGLCPNMLWQTAPLLGGKPGGQTFFNQIALNLPVFERREQEPVSLLIIERRDGPRVPFRTFPGFFQFAFGFYSTPLSASASSTCPCHHCSVLFFSLPIIRITI
jgi:hypothetical protein